MPILSTVRKYKQEEVDLNVLARKASQVYGKQPFKWQLDTALAILCGEEVFLDLSGFSRNCGGGTTAESINSFF